MENVSLRNALAFIFLILAGMVLSGLAAFITRDLEERNIFAAQREATELLSNVLHEHHERNTTILRAVHGLFLASDIVTRREFQTFATTFLELYPEIQALQWIPKVEHADRLHFEQSARAEGFDDFKIREQRPNRLLVSAESRTRYFPIYFLEPLTGNERAFGFDLASSEASYRTMRNAWTSGEVRATAGIRLLPKHDNQREKSILLFIPLYENSPVRALPDLKRLRGFILGTFNLHAIMANSLAVLQQEVAGLDISLADISRIASPECLYCPGEDQAIASPEGAWRYSRVMQIAGRVWQLNSEAREDYITGRRSALPWVVLLTGMSFTVFLGVYIGSLVRREKNVRQLVATRTKKLLVSEEQNKIVLDNAANAIIAINGRGKISVFNSAAERMFGYSCDEVLERNVSLLMPEPHRSSHDSYLKHYRESGQAKVIGNERQVDAMHKNGQLFPVNLSVGEANIDGDPMFIGVLVDLTLQQEHQRALIREKEAAEEANRQKSSFLNMISHELRTPLTVILGYLPILQNERHRTDPESVRKIADDMSASGKHLLELINDLLDISKIEAGQMELNLEDCDVGVQVESVADRLRPQAELKKISLDNQIHNTRFKLDPLRFRQIMINLIGNAIKFTQEGSVQISARLEDRVLIVEVSDTGCGIPEADLSCIFEAFRQVDSSRTRSQGGSGLGLAITQRLIALHGGTISAANNAGGGTRFTFSLQDGAGL